MLVRLSPSGPALHVRALVFVGQVELGQDVSTKGPDLPFEPVPGASILVPEVRAGYAGRLSACLSCSNDAPGGLVLFAFRAIGTDIISREIGTRGGGLALEWFQEIPEAPPKPGPVLLELVWRSTIGRGAIRAAKPTDGEGGTFSVAVFDRAAPGP